MSQAQRPSDAHKAAGEADSRLVLHTGDLVLLKVQLNANDRYAEAIEKPEDTGYIRSHTTGQGIELIVEPVTQFQGNGVEIRDYLFTVIDYMSYAAQKDYQRRKKHLAQQLGDQAAGNVSSYKQLAIYEERANQEAQQNFERIHSKHQKPIKYGQVIQLQHLRTERFICVRAKMPATLHRVARKIELEPGCAASLLRIQPFFHHVSQGDPVMLTEQVEIESTKLGNRWNISWTSCHDTADDHVYEVNFAKGGRGIYMMLYSRGTTTGACGVEVGLSFSTPLRLFSPHNCGYLSASASHKKANPYMRKQAKHEEHNAKDVWIIEPAHQGEDHMIEFGTTKVVLRHFASGRYLAIKEKDTQELFTDATVHSLVRVPTSLDVVDSFSGLPACGAALLSAPDKNCHMVMEPTQGFADGEHTKVPLTPCSFMLRWVHPQKRNAGMWFTVKHHEKKGRRESLHVGFVVNNFSRDALRCEVLAHDRWMAECDVVAEHKTNLVERITPRCKDFADRRVAVTVCAHCELALTDMLLFLADSPFWRAENEHNRQPDPLQTSWAAHPQRQILVRELKYIDASFDLFHELVKQTPRLVENRSHTLWRVALMSLSVDAQMQQAAQEDQANEVLLALQTRCLKLIVRVWLYCFLGSEENENYFLRRGWLETIDRLNGHGLGAADVFVSLAGSSSGMARRIHEESMHKFVDFIGSLGPLDTWLNFLRVVCAPQGVALAIKQQQVCIALVCAGNRSSAAERARAQRNRDVLLIAIKLGAPLGRPLGMPIRGATPPPLEQCLARDLLVEGTKELAISWTYSENWTHGQGTLYHSPSALGLTPAQPGQPHARIWVPLAHVVWVLQPERCCYAATGRTWEDVKPEFEGILEGTNAMVPDTTVPASGSRIELLTTLAKYFLAQLKLVSAMCKGKQMNCIMSVQEEYPLSVCVCGASDPRLPTCIRSAFYDLITDLWVDRRPHSTIEVPAVVRCLPESGSVSVPHDALPAFHMPTPHEPDAWSDQHMASLPADVREFYSLCRPEKLEAVMWSLRQYFSAGPDVEQQVHSNEDDNALMVSVLRLLRFLLLYGFISSLPLVRELIGPVLRCLDGRIDFVDPAARPVNMTTKSAAEDDNMMCDPSEPLLPRVRRPTIAFDDPESTLIGARFPALDEHTQRWVSCPENQGVVETKIRMVEVLTAFLHLDMHVKMSRVLELFRAHRGTNFFDDVPQKVVRILAEPDVPISQPRIRAPSVMLIDLLMYEDSALFTAVLKFLFKVHGQTAELMETLSRIELLTPAQVSLYFELQVDVASIGQTIHSFENWGADDHFSSVDHSVYAKLLDKCNKIRRLCKEGAPKFSTSAYEVQKMLHETEFFSLVVFVIVTNPLDFHPSSREMYRQMTRDICSVSASFVANNPKNQGVAFLALHNLRELMASGTAETALMVAAIFRGNFDLCKRVPEDLLTLFGELMLKERRAGRFSPWYISFFLAVVNVGQQPITVNQIKTMDILSDSDGVLHILPGAQGRSRLLSLASKFQSANMLLDPDVRSWTDGNDAELIYYVHSVELLVGLAISHGNQMLLNKPFATSHMSVPTLVDLLMTIEAPERQTNDSNTGFSIYRHLRTRYMQLLHAVFYDVDSTHINGDFLASSVHMDLLRKFLLWAGKILRMPEDASGLHRLAAPAPRSRNGDQIGHMLTVEEEAHLHAILDCIDDCFNGPHLGILRENFENVIGTLNVILEDYFQRFEWLVKVMKNPDCQEVLGVHDIEHLKITAHRIVTATSCDTGSGDQGPVPAKAKAKTGKRAASSIYEAQWNAMMEQLVSSEVIRDRMAEEEEMIGAYISNIAQLTDPQLASYRTDLPKDRSKGLPDGVDFRRGIITTEDVLGRFVRHCNEHLHRDTQTVTLIQSTLRALLVIAQRSTDQAALAKTQAIFVKSGIMGLIVKILDARLTTQCTNASWTLLAMALQGNDEHQMVNKDVQKGLYEVCANGDDSGVWVSFSEAVSNVCNEVKMARTLQKLDSHTEEEVQQLDDYEGHVATVVTAMRAARLMVEGHYFPMQQYLFSQVGNSRSCNVAGEVARLMIRICKDPLSAELASVGELNCVSEALSVLTELTQGPNLRTQEYLCTVGLVENVAKLLASDFDRQCRAADDLYPTFVRRLKAQLVEGLLALLEGRMDSKNHTAIIERMDPHCLKERIEFVYLYFVFGSATVSSGTINLPDDTPAAVPLDHPVCSLVTNADEDASRVWDELQMATGVAEELLEDLEDRELNEFFGEGLRVLELIRILGPHSATFESTVLPNPQILAWADEREGYPTEAEYLEQRKVHYTERLYKHAFNFMSRFVLTIEVLLNGQLQCIHFQQPLTALWYVHGAAKQHILDSVPFSSPDVKMKAFVSMCSKLHGESKLIRDLSRFSIVPGRYLKTARRYLPDGAHRPFQVFLANDAFWMQRLLSSQLFLGLALASHMGVFLVPQPGASASEAVWISPLASQVANTMGAIYLANATLWVCLTICIKVPLSLRRFKGQNRVVIVAKTILQDASLLWRAVLALVSGSALLWNHSWLYSFLLMDFFSQSATLFTVLKAVGTPVQSLLMTFLGTVIVTFVYASVGYHYFMEDYGDYCASDIMTCTVNILYQATRNGIVGLSSMMALVMPGSRNWMARVAYDMSYFIVLGIMILNTIVGIIVDSFSQLRQEAFARQNNQESQTFISCIDKKTIDAAANGQGIADGFAYHETYKQPKWDYMAFVFHLREKSLQDYTGPEQIICHMIEEEDVTWLPIGRSKMLEEDEGSAWQDDIMVRIEKHLDVLVRSMSKSTDANARLQSSVLGLQRWVKEQLSSLMSAFESTPQALPSAYVSEEPQMTSERTPRRPSPKASDAQRGRRQVSLFG